MERRRERGDLRQDIKISSGLAEIQGNAGALFKTGRKETTKRNGKTIVRQHATTGLRCKFYNVRVVNEWNLLPEEVIEVR